MRTILITGSRKYLARDTIFLALLCEPNIQGWGDEQVEIIHGGAQGADMLSDSVAVELGYDVRVFPADWSRYGKRAGPLRNLRMLAEAPDLVMAFGNGRGTEHTIGEAEKQRIPVRRFA